MSVSLSTTQTAWSVLHDELALWQDAGRVAKVWWRDDDAVSAGPRLERLTDLSEKYKFPLGLAVIPANLQPSLIEALAKTNWTRVLQHGFAHLDHSPKDERGAWELGLHRGLDVTLKELAEGRAILADAFADKFLHIVVPPWNRLDEALIPHLAEVGYDGVSGFGDKPSEGNYSKLIISNSHCDPVSWKRGAVFAGTEKTLNQFVERLTFVREKSDTASGLTGYLTHHAVMDEESWLFTNELFDVLSAHPAVEFEALEIVFRP